MVRWRSMRMPDSGYALGDASLFHHHYLDDREEGHEAALRTGIHAQRVSLP